MTSEARFALRRDRVDAGVALRWPTGPWMLTILVLTTIGSAAFLGSTANPMASVGVWGYAAWLAAAAVGFLAARSVATVAATSRRSETPGPLDDPFTPLDPPVVERFRRRMGGWGGYVAGVTQIFGMVAATSLTALLVGGTIFPGNGGAARGAAIVYLVLLALARVLLPEPRRGLTVVVVVVALLGLAWLGIHIQSLRPEATPARAPGEVTLGSVLEATALLPLAFLPVLRMTVMLPGVRSARSRILKRWVLPATALTAVALAALLGDGVAGVLPVSSPDGTALAQAVIGCPSPVRLTLLGVTLAFGTVFALILLDDTQLVAGWILRANALPDVFAAPPGRRVSVTGELPVVVAGALGVVLAPGLGDLIALSGFCVLMLFAGIHLAAMRPASDGRHQVRILPLAGLVGSAVLFFCLPPEVILLGVVVVSLAVLLRAVFIVWSEPLVPDIVEGVATSTAPARRPEDAPGDLPADDRAGRAEHRAER